LRESQCKDSAQITTPTNPTPKSTRQLKGKLKLATHRAVSLGAKDRISDFKCSQSLNEFSAISSEPS
jgi:hypothetical protein